MRRLLILLVLAPAFASAATCFPQAAESKSPFGHYSIEWHAPTDGETHHLSLVKNGEVTDEKHFVEFGRSACVVWAPDGDQFALVLNSASNVATTAIYQISNISRPIEIAAYFSPATRARLRQFGHLYIRAVVWTAQGITIEITGHQDQENGITLQEAVLCKPKEEGFACNA